MAAGGPHLRRWRGVSCSGERKGGGEASFSLRSSWFSRGGGGGEAKFNARRAKVGGIWSLEETVFVLGVRDHIYPFEQLHQPTWK